MSEPLLVICVIRLLDFQFWHCSCFSNSFLNVTVAFAPLTSTFATTPRPPPPELMFWLIQLWLTSG
jgi:hypothetical protein